MNTKDNNFFLESLINTPTPSGYETCYSLINSELSKYHKEPVFVDKIGNVFTKCGNGPIKILLSGHIDEVYASVINISEDGMISIKNIGGIDRKDLTASIVQLITDNNESIEGIVIKAPIHIEHKEDSYNRVTDFEDFRIDIGCETKEEVLKKGIHPGTPVLYKKGCCLNFGENKMYGTGLDDKIGVFVSEEIFRTIIESNLKEWQNKYTVYFLASTQEEVGCRSVCIAAKNINPDVSIDFDVTFATDGDLGLKKNVYGDICLGKGAVINYGPDKSLRLNKILKEEATIYQYGVSSAGGTNTDNIQKFSNNCETTLVSIPNRSMHTRVETCDWRDVDSAVEMVSNAIIRMKI